MKVLLGFGGSDAGWRALERELERLADGADLLAVGIVETAGSDRDPESLRRQVEEALSGRGVEAEVGLLRGEAGPALVEAAEAGGYDRLTLADGRRTPAGKVKLGPVVEYVVLNAPVTVVLLR